MLGSLLSKKMRMQNESAKYMVFSKKIALLEFAAEVVLGKKVKNSSLKSFQVGTPLRKVFGRIMNF